MTIDEAIEQFKYDAECNRADLDFSYAEDNEQIAEWLEDYKQIKMLIPIEQALKAEYSKAIDDFRNELKNHYTEYNLDCILSDSNFYSYTAACDYLEDYIDKIAAKLKKGVENDN